MKLAVPVFCDRDLT